MLGDTIQITEVLWTSAALMGLYSWLVNMRTALITLRASRAIKETEVGSLWLIASAMIIGLMLFVETVYTAIGIVSMTAAPSPTASAVRLWFFATLFIGSSVAITGAGWIWRWVDRGFTLLAERSITAGRDTTSGDDER